MRFALGDDHISFRDAVSSLLAKECPPAAVRAAWEDGPVDRGPWDALAAMGVLDMLVAEADGGLGLDETFLVPVLEECGRVALPHPMVETAMVAAPLLGAGAGMVTTDLGGSNVPWAADADAIVVSHGSGLRLLPRGTAVLPSTSPSMDRSRRLGRIRDLDDPDLLDDLTFVTDDPDEVARARDRGALGTAATLIGLGQAMLDMTVAYVKERHQFGKPVGSFQAVKHHLADGALALELARPPVWRAAWSLATAADTAPRDVSIAKAMASEAAELVATKALQCHGAIGYTVEHDLHLYLKRTWALSRAWGDVAHHTDRVAELIGATDA